jgi:Domain of unknown function (DUF4411)
MYSIDTSGILDGFVRLYPPDTFPALWNRIDALILVGELRACEMVQVEISKKDDVALEWMKSRPELVSPLDERRQQLVKDILRDYPRLVDTKKGRSGADPFVIALGMTLKCPIITGESKTRNMTSPRIPDVCNALGLETIGFLEFIRREKWKSPRRSPRHRSVRFYHIGWGGRLNNGASKSAAASP